MKLLWVKGDLLHPTTRGGRIRTLEMLRRLHRRHEVHYVAYVEPAHPEAVRQSAEYCARIYPIEHHIPNHHSPAFLVQVAKGWFESLPVAVSRYRSRRMQAQIAQLLAREKFDRLVCDFIFPAPNIARIEDWILFQHNVETMIWRRHAENAADPLRKLYFRLQAARMFAYERAIATRAARVVAVSPQDAALMRSLFGLTGILDIPTGVDVEHFAPPAAAEPRWDLVFVGAMDWLPNVDAVGYFVREILPRIRSTIPDCSLVVAGRAPSPETLALARNDAHITVTGTVPDVRPYLWSSKLSIVPLRIGGGTRLKIYESMAAQTPVVSTSIGAEGLVVDHPRNIRLADTPEAFAEECVELLNNREEARRMAAEARQMVAARFSWDQVTESFERILTG